VVKNGHHLKFSYVLPDKEGEHIQLVIPSALQMNWAESPTFFCVATETAKDVAEHLTKKQFVSLALHALESLMLPPEK